MTNEPNTPLNLEVKLMHALAHQYNVQAKGQSEKIVYRSK